MAQTVKLKRSAVAAKVPLTSDLALGELAANTCDGVLYTLMNDGTNKVVQVGGQSVSATVTAGTNAQGQGPLTSNVNLVTVTTANPSGVTLPTALLGRKLLVFNRGTNPINVYPATGAQIDALGTNVSVQIPVKGWLEFNATSTTQWYSSFGTFINNGSNIYSSISKAPGSNFENFFAGTCAGSTTGNYNNYIGYCAGALSSGADCNNFFGKYAGVRTTGDKNNFLGPYAGCSNVGGYNNNFIGDFAGSCNTSGCYNVFLGSGAGFNNLTANNNIAMGRLPGYNNTTGANNIFFGSESGWSNSTNSNVIAIGCRAGYWNQGNSNIYFGECSGASATRTACTTGINNIFVGKQSGINVTTGNQNFFLGAYAGCLTTTGSCNVIVGGFTGTGFTTSSNHIFLSDGAGNNRLMFNNSGALGISGANYGSAGQILTSCGSSLAPVWANPGTVTASNSVLDSITAGFNGTTATFNLTLTSVAYTPANAAQLTVVLGGVVQKPGTDYTVSTSTITFTTAPASNLDCFIIANGGYASVSDGDKGDITVSGTGTVWTIDNNVVTNAKLAQVATATLKGRVTAATGNVEDLTGTQATTLLDTFTSALKGLAPASGGGTTNFLRADGTWASVGDVFLADNNVFTGANTFTNATGQTFRQAATQDGIIVTGRAGGTGSFDVILTPATLSADQTLTLPNVTGTVVTTGDTGSVTSTMIATETIANTDVSLTAAIAGTKISPDFGAQLIQSSQANQALSLTGTLNPSATSNGLLSVGTLGFTGARMGGNFTSSQTSYYQVVLQNTSNNAGASTDFVVCNNASTDTATYGNFGINSSTFTGTGSLNLPSATYLSATTGDLVLGTTTSNPIRFVVNSGATDAFGINTSGAWLVAGSAGTSGQTYRSGGSAAAPSWSNIGTSQIVSLTSTQQSTATALANVTQLVASLEANATYTVDCFVTFQSAATTTGLNLGFTSPTGCNPMVEIVVPITSTAAASQLRTTFPNAGSTTSGSVLGTGVTAINSNHTARLSGIIKNGGTAGNFQIQFATEVAASAVTLQIGSTMQLTRIA